MQDINKELDKILEKLVNDSQYDWTPPDYTAKPQVIEAKQALYKDMVAILGEDEVPTRIDRKTDNDIPKEACNNLRQELHTKLKEYYGVGIRDINIPVTNEPSDIKIHKIK